MIGVYVAASSNELARASAAMRAVENAGYRLTLDWVAVIEKAGGVASPNPAAVGGRDMLVKWSRDAMCAIDAARVFWLLAPQADHGRGAFFEFGFAVAQGKHVIVSGPARACSIFTALADCVAFTDTEAVDFLEIITRDMRG